MLTLPPKTSRRITRACYLARVQDRPVAPDATANAAVTSSTLVIPTLRRPDSLRRSLAGVRVQTRQFDQVLVSVRPEDKDSRDVIAKADGLAVREILVHRPGAVAARNAAMDVATGDICVFLDDDAVPPPEWHELLVQHFEADSRIGAVGGRDRIYHDGRLVVGHRPHVGTVRPYGRFIGLYHLGTGEARDVDVLKGVNMSVRLGQFPWLRFDENLRGNGAEHNEDWALSLAVKDAGYRVIFDPAIWVDHYEAERIDVDQRFNPEGRAVYDRAFNQTYAGVRYLPLLKAMVHACYALAVGSRSEPGLLACLYRLPRDEFRPSVSALNCAWRGRLAAIRCAWRLRRFGRDLPE